MEIDPRYYRSAEVDILLGCSSKARNTLGWKPRVSFDELVAMMIDSDLKLARREQVLIKSVHEFALHRG